ncbi:hypothetical protein OK016_02305 [Vibrio chagasii]|nr:hypothetical protein [Vibrio chagasii]
MAPHHSDKLSDDELIKIAKDSETMGLFSTVLFLRFLIAVFTLIMSLVATLQRSTFYLRTASVKAACITGQLSKVDSRDRFSRVSKCLVRVRYRIRRRAVCRGTLDHQGTTKLRCGRLLDRDPGDHCDYFCQNDNIALAVYDVAAERNPHY